MNANSRKRGSRARAGFTLYEVALAVIILLVGLMALSASAVHVQGLARSARERMTAQNALRAKAEEVRSISRAGLSDPLGWGVHVVNAMAGIATFQVEGLTPVEGQPTVGTLRLITDETLSDTALGVELGMPRDLDGDSLANNPAVAHSARLLPVVLEVRWTSAWGEQRIIQGLWILGY
jgi:type II secretory pathway pseudopilin PulG